jgi:hypothetical protein
MPKLLGNVPPDNYNQFLRLNLTNLKQSLLAYSGGGDLFGISWFSAMMKKKIKPVQR